MEEPGMRAGHVLQSPPVPGFLRQAGVGHLGQPFAFDQIRRTVTPVARA